MDGGAFMWKRVVLFFVFLPGTVSAWPASQETVLPLFQVTRELLFGVVKHASAKPAHVESGAKLEQRAA